MKKLNLLLITTLIVLAGCSSTYNYNVEPTPLQKGKAKYFLKNFNLKLTHGSGQNKENKTFKNEKELKQSFEDFINKELIKQSLKGTSTGFQFSVDMNYERTYNYGGNALNKPEFYYTVKIYSYEKELLANFDINKSTTKYSYLKDIVVNAEIAVFKWDAKDEPKDIALIAKTLVRELANLGK